MLHRAGDIEPCVRLFMSRPGVSHLTLVSAQQIRDQVADVADVIIYAVGLSDMEIKALEVVTQQLGVGLRLMEEISLPEGTFWSGSLSKTALGRLLLPQYLDLKYRSVLYIDGDTQIVGDVRPLVLLDVPHGKIAAAPDVAWDPRKGNIFPEGYFEGLGIDKPENYFSSGVLALERATLDDVMPEVHDFFLRNSLKLCRFHDQSALNAVMNKSVFSLSPR